MAYQLQTINRYISEDPSEFLKRSDEVFNLKIADVVDQIIENISISPIVLMAGPSGSGKTTTAQKITEALERRGIHSHSISMDSYFLDVNPETSPRTEDGKYDFESPLCMDMKLLNEHFRLLSDGEGIHVPHYDFPQQKRIGYHTEELRLGKNEIAIFEGIHAFNDDCAGKFPKAFCLYISASSNIVDGDELVFQGSWMRLIRRIARDASFRNTNALETLMMWDNVRRGEKLYITPYIHRANYSFDSALPYELSVLKPFVEPLLNDVLQHIPEGTPRREELAFLIKCIDEFSSIDLNLVAPDSLVREFTGGGTYQYD